MQGRVPERLTVFPLMGCHVGAGGAWGSKNSNSSSDGESGPAPPLVSLRPPSGTSLPRAPRGV